MGLARRMACKQIVKHIHGHGWDVFDLQVTIGAIQAQRRTLEPMTVELSGQQDHRHRFQLLIVFYEFTKLKTQELGQINVENGGFGMLFLYYVECVYSIRG